MCVSHSFTVSLQVLVCTRKLTIIRKDASIQLIRVVYARGCRQHADFYRGTLELAARIGRRPMRVLVDSGSTGNYIDARECIARRIKIEAEDQSEELKMADGTMVKTEGRVQFVLKCGGYRGQISARVFPNMNKPMILGIPWLSKENPHIDWTQAIVAVNKDHHCISLPLAKPLQSNPVHLANKISANQANQMLKRKEVERAFLGII